MLSSGSAKSISVSESVSDLVDWLARLAFTSVAPGLSYQRKKTALLFLSAVLETCTDTWSPDKKKGQPPGEGGHRSDPFRAQGNKGMPGLGLRSIVVVF